MSAATMPQSPTSSRGTPQKVTNSSSFDGGRASSDTEERPSSTSSGSSQQPHIRVSYEGHDYDFATPPGSSPDPEYGTFLPQSRRGAEQVGKEVKETQPQPQSQSQAQPLQSPRLRKETSQPRLRVIPEARRSGSNDGGGSGESNGATPTGSPAPPVPARISGVSSRKPPPPPAKEHRDDEIDEMR